MTQTMVGQPKSVTASVVEKIANAEGVDEYDIAPLFESVDPDALETIFDAAESAEQVAVEFEHCGYQITIDGGCISVDGHADDS